MVALSLRGFPHFNGPDMLRTVDNTPSSSLQKLSVEKSYEEYSLG